MRLLVVSQYFWPEQFRINDLTEELTARGHEVTVLTGIPNYPTGSVFPEYAAAPERFASYAGAEVHRVPMATRGNTPLRLLLNYVAFPISATVYGLVALRAREFDATLVFEPSPVTVGLPAVALRKARGWPVAFWVLDQWPETLAAVGAVRSGRVLRWVGRLVSFIYSRCDVILSQSRALMPQIARYCPPGHDVRYFPNWVESGYETDGAAPAPEIPERRDLFNVMFAGNIGESQDFPAILDAADALREDDRIRWLIVGDGRMAEWVRRESRRRGLSDRFIMLGRHATHRMPSFYRHADALLVSLKAGPIFSMTVPGKIQSYLASGIPVLAMLDGEGARVIEEAGAGFTCGSSDARGLAANVRRMASLSPAERAALGERGRAYASREFGRDMLVTRLEQALAGIAATRRAAS